ncbi:hypothetical protein DB30_06199 [Enhygromyxa salina]|uniref:Uncharacterized protein n=1 Tax=Enhygromyxa salina TaxID=215803 RepID=A0A0C2D480_9BACT|nr:hypothetical protein [Enhygromyxa salina]KIG14897.1 hypothetical protein DB30_06199 [Enhygromyxa salina]
MQSLSRACPLCGVDDEGQPDPLGVYRCRGCEIEFRPPLRVPIRRAGVSAVPVAGSDNRAVMWILAGVGATIGVAIAAGDSQAPSKPAPFQLDEINLAVPTFEPVHLSGLEGVEELYDPFARVELEHEVHASVFDHGDFVATGLLRNPSAAALGDVSMHARFLDSTGALVATLSATVACLAIQPNEVCAWSLDAPVPVASEVVFEANGARGLLVDLPTLAARGRFDLQGKAITKVAVPSAQGLRLNPPSPRGARDDTAWTVIFPVDAGTVLLDSWAAVTSLDEEDQVLGVELATRSDPQLGDAELRISVAVAQHEGTHAYEVRVGGHVMRQPVDPGVPPL